MVYFNGTNSIGWTQLIDGNITQAAFAVFDDTTALSGWTIILLYFVFQIMLYAKTRNLTLGFVMGVMFTTIYIYQATIAQHIAPNIFAIPVLSVLLYIQFGGMLYSWVVK